LGVVRFEKRMIGIRIKAALAVKKRRGECVGECTFGFASDESGKLVANDVEQQVIQRIQRLAAEALSQRAIAAQLAVEGVVGRSGKPYSQTQVGRTAKLAA
jgi:DNA invertase Pin-like site-specific DNA recombinase